MQAPFWTGHGIDASIVIGVTPGTNTSMQLEASAHDEAQYASRAAEIHAWLAAHPAVRRFAVIDDRPCASDAALAAHFVRTDHRSGLTDDDVEAVLRVLERDARDP